MEEKLPPGFRFHPTDEELITYYLKKKVSDFGFTSKAIADVDLNKCEPWDLPAKASMGEKEWYFFNLRDRKYPTGLRANRATEAGYWKTTGKDKEIFHGGVLVGMKKTLVFYRGRAPKGDKSNWVMHEYRLETKFGFRTTKDEWVVCRIFQKSTFVKKPPPISSLSSLDSPDDANTGTNEFGDMEQVPNLITIPSPSSSMHINAPMQNYGNYLNMNWLKADREHVGSHIWPNTSLLHPNLDVDSLLLRAWQLRNTFQQQPNEVVTSTGQSLGISGNFGPTNYDLLTPSSGAVELVQPQQQQSQDRTFNADSIW